MFCLNFSCRYSDILEQLLRDLDAIEILRLDYEDDYQGFVDIDVLLNNNRVFSYKYYYGSCSGCDDWEDRELNKDQIKQEMLTESTIFDYYDQYCEWRKNCNITGD